MSNIDLTSIRSRWVAEASTSDLGLWWLADDIREELGEQATEDQVRAATLQAVRPLLESGEIRAVSLLEGGAFEVWPGDVDEQLALIGEQWRLLGKPDIGDIVWFVGPRSFDAVAPD
jgi:hypothetical protein